jgi:hypothetical protein
MKRLAIAVLILFVLAAVPALADRPLAQQLAPEGGISPGELTATPEMWFYEQYQREYQDPTMAVRRNAEYRATQRRERMAALKWFGFSNQRPQAGPEPFHGEWSPVWTSNNGVYPYRWGGVGWPWIVNRSSFVVWPSGPVVTTY